jgi:predicted RNA-binding Zn-ribbon protein involved in translation (DUF1610 family)
VSVPYDDQDLAFLLVARGVAPREDVERIYRASQSESERLAERLLATGLVDGPALDRLLKELGKYQFRCRSCNDRFVALPRTEQRTVDCPKCGKKNIVPAATVHLAQQRPPSDAEGRGSGNKVRQSQDESDEAVGLIDPKTGRRPWAVVQLRQENAEGTVYGLVGFQTRLKWPEQKRVFSMIPGLEKAEFVRYGQIHRNTYIDSPRLLNITLQMKDNPNLFFAGQIIGVEGYVESAAAGIIAGINAARYLKGQELLVLPKETMLGALLDYVANCPEKDFQPMNAIFGIMPPLGFRCKDKQERNQLFAERAIKALEKVE